MADPRGTYLSQIALIQQRAGDRQIDLTDLDPSRRNARVVPLMIVDRMKQNLRTKDIEATVAPGVIKEDLVGTKNSSNVTFTISQIPSPGSLLIKHQNADVTEVASSPAAGEYSISSKTITMGTAPDSGDSLWAYYQTA